MHMRVWKNDGFLSFKKKKKIRAHSKSILRIYAINRRNDQIQLIFNVI